MKTLKLIKNDPWLAPYKQAIAGLSLIQITAPTQH